MPFAHSIKSELRARAAYSAKPIHRTLYERYMAALALGDTVEALRERVAVWAASERQWAPGAPPKPVNPTNPGGTPAAGSASNDDVELVQGFGRFYA